MLRSAHLDETSSPGASGLVTDHGVAIVGKSLVIKGDLIGSESLWIEGKVEGSIYLYGNRLTVGHQGQVVGSIMANEIVVFGQVNGNCEASDRVDIRSGSSLTGDVTTPRISIEDGAYFKGGIDIRAVRQNRQLAVEGSALAASYDSIAEASIEQGHYHTLEEESDIDRLLPKWRSPRGPIARSKTTAEAH